MAQAKLLVLGNIASGKSELARALGRETGWPVAGIDDARRRVGDGTPAGEARAWSDFLEVAEAPAPAVLECTGGGPFVHLLRLAFQCSTLPWGVVLVRTSAEECLRRARLRGFDVPYPDFGVALEEVVVHVERELDRLVGTVWPTPLCTVDGAGDVSTSTAQIAPRLRSWLSFQRTP